MTEIKWINGSTRVGENHTATRFLECTRDCYFIQHVKEHIRIGKK